MPCTNDAACAALSSTMCSFSQVESMCPTLCNACNNVPATSGKCGQGMRRGSRPSTCSGPLRN
jgi:hypothetical protein